MAEGSDTTYPVVPKMEMTEEYLDGHGMDESCYNADEENHQKLEEDIKFDPPTIIHENQDVQRKTVKLQKQPKKIVKLATVQQKREKESYICNFCNEQLANKRSTFLHMKKYHMSK